MSKDVIEIDIESEIQKIIRQLDSVPNQIASPKLLKNALNSAARKVRKQMVQDVKGEYAVTKQKILRDKAQGAPQVLTASTSSLASAIKSRGPMQEIMTFKTRPNTPTTAPAAQVLASGSLKLLETNGRKAFTVTFTNKKSDGSDSTHTAIVDRQGKARFPLKKLLSPSVPHMLNNEAVRGPAEDMTYELLQAEIQRRIEKIKFG